MYRYTKLSLLVIAITMTGTVVYAAKAHIQSDALAATQVEIPLIQVIAVTEQHANGKASCAEHEQSKQGWVRNVEVMSGAKVFDARIDADRGTVIPAVENKADHDDVHDKQDRLRTATLGPYRG